MDYTCGIFIKQRPKWSAQNQGQKDEHKIKKTPWIPIYMSHYLVHILQMYWWRPIQASAAASEAELQRNLESMDKIGSLTDTRLPKNPTLIPLQTFRARIVPLWLPSGFYMQGIDREYSFAWILISYTNTSPRLFRCEPAYLSLHQLKTSRIINMNVK